MKPALTQWVPLVGWGRDRLVLEGVVSPQGRFLGYEFVVSPTILHTLGAGYPPDGVSTAFTPMA